MKSPGTNIAAAFVSVALFAPILWMVLDREPPYTDHRGYITPDRAHPGETITVHWSVNIRRVCRGTVHRQIIDSQGVICNYDTQEVRIATKADEDSKSIKRSFPLCDKVAPGPAKYRAFTCYECNPLQHAWPVCTQTPDVNFTVIPNDGNNAKP